MEKGSRSLDGARTDEPAAPVNSLVRSSGTSCQLETQTPFSCVISIVSKDHSGLGIRLFFFIRF